MYEPLACSDREEKHSAFTKRASVFSTHASMPAPPVVRHLLTGVGWWALLVAVELDSFCLPHRCADANRSYLPACGDRRAG